MADNELETTTHIPDELLARRKEYIEHMEERRNLANKMMKERRQAAEERHKATLLKMHQTNTTPAITDSKRANRA